MKLLSQPAFLANSGGQTKLQWKFDEPGPATLFIQYTAAELAAANFLFELNWTLFSSLGASLEFGSQPGQEGGASSPPVPWCGLCYRFYAGIEVNLLVANVQPGQTTGYTAALMPGHLDQSSIMEALPNGDDTTVPPFTTGVYVVSDNAAAVLTMTDPAGATVISLTTPLPAGFPSTLIPVGPTVKTLAVAGGAMQLQFVTMG